MKKRSTAAATKRRAPAPRASKEPNLREVAECACFHTRRAARVITHEFDQALSAVGLRSTQYAVLCALAGPWPAPPTVNRLAEYLLVEPSALSRNVAILARRGLIRADRGADRRQRVLVLTPGGKRTFRAGFVHWRRAQSELGARLGKKRLHQTVAMLQAVVGPQPTMRALSN